MESKELIEKVARDLATLNDGTEETWESYHADAQKACSVILATLQEPTRAMYDSAHKYYEGEAYLPHGLWKAMLNASPLGEQSE